uniref:RING-type E3 ubiquitin transferase n=1 Tax=Latimeria chalumnae TaxID=7897 RepID=H3B5Y7_LATCH
MAEAAAAAAAAAGLRTTTTAAATATAPSSATSSVTPAVAGGWTKQVTCRYYMHGVCKEGINCRYSHELSSNKPPTICKYYQKGCCVYGKFCRFDHVKPSKQEETNTPKPAKMTDSATTSTLAPLSKLAETDSKAVALPSYHEDWINAVEFVPGQPYYARAAIPCTEEPEQGLVIEEEYEKQKVGEQLKKQLCPYATVGECRYGENCAYLHGDVCDMCGLRVLHPIDTAQRSQHIKSCIEAHEKDMELSFAVQRSKDMACGICMEVVYEKANPSDRRFGILSNCNHTYCLKCIRKWRSAKQFESKIIKSCPECRITSNFVIPSEYWVEEKEEKQKLIQKYKEAMSNKLCRYFDEGRGKCPFGGNCFYKHAYPDGRLEEPQPQRRQTGSSGRHRVSKNNACFGGVEYYVQF